MVARGVRYAADNGAKVINLSIGREDGGPATAVTDAIRYAVSKGCLRGGRVRQHARRRQPAESARATSRRRIDGMVAVGAVGRTLELAFYSTTAPYVELSAPGGDQRQAGGTPRGILQQTLDLDLLETYNRPVSQYGPPRADSFAY